MYALYVRNIIHIHTSIRWCTRMHIWYMCITIVRVLPSPIHYTFQKSNSSHEIYDGHWSRRSLGEPITNQSASTITLELPNCKTLQDSRKDSSLILGRWPPHFMNPSLLKPSVEAVLHPVRNPLGEFCSSHEWQRNVKQGHGYTWNLFVLFCLTFFPLQKGKTDCPIKTNQNKCHFHLIHGGIKSSTPCN